MDDTAAAVDYKKWNVLYGLYPTGQTTLLRRRININDVDWSRNNVVCQWVVARCSGFTRSNKQLATVWIQAGHDVRSLVRPLNFVTSFVFIVTDHVDDQTNLPLFMCHFQSYFPGVSGSNKVTIISLCV